MARLTNQAKGGLAGAVGAVTYLFSAFNGALTKIAPPEQQQSAMVLTTLTHFVILVVLLVVMWLTRREEATRTTKIPLAWIVFAVIMLLVSAAFFAAYYVTLNRFVYVWPSDDQQQQMTHVRGQYTFGFMARDYRTGGIAEVFQGTSGDDGYKNRYQLWTVESEQHSRMVLDVQYALLAVTLASGVFCISQGLLGKYLPAELAEENTG